MPDAPDRMHRYSADTEQLAREILESTLDRLRMDAPLDGPATEADLRARAGRTITEDGLGHDALRVFDDVLAPAIISSDHPRFLAFIPNAPTEASTLFDLVAGAASIYGGSWLESSGAVFAENEALRWIADLAEMPAGAGGCFVQGGTLGNLSALVAARQAARDDGQRPGHDGRWRVAASAEAHSSVAGAARVMDIDVLPVPTDERGRLTATALSETLDAHGGAGVFATVATAGTTNLGVIDDLAGVASICADRGLWFHVDGAYGAAALAAPSVRHRFAGIERADSLIVDPHKWLFAPYDGCALLYREPSRARRAHVQAAAYLEPVAHTDGEWNPSDYAIHLTRRARGLPLWFSLAVHGTRAYRDAIEGTLAVARAAATEIRRRSFTELVVEPDLSVVPFRRLGWLAADYAAWSARLLDRGHAFVTPTAFRGEPITRFAVVNPRTTAADLRGIIATMA